MYRVYRVHRDNEGNIFHRVPVGCARTEKGARALVAGQCGECVIEKYHNINKLSYRLHGEKGKDMKDEIKVGALASEYMARYKRTDVVVIDVRYFVDFIAVDLSDGSVWFTDR